MQQRVTVARKTGRGGDSVFKCRPEMANTIDDLWTVNLSGFVGRGKNRFFFPFHLIRSVAAPAVATANGNNSVKCFNRWPFVRTGSRVSYGTTNFYVVLFIRFRSGNVRFFFPRIVRGGHSRGQQRRRYSLTT